jgi:hypothetical protein
LLTLIVPNNAILLLELKIAFYVFILCIRPPTKLREVDDEVAHDILDADGYIKEDERPIDKCLMDTGLGSDSDTVDGTIESSQPGQSDSNGKLAVPSATIPGKSQQPELV